MISCYTGCSITNDNKDRLTMLTANGKFDVKLTPQEDVEAAGRMTINKAYTGDMVGSGIGQMISKRTEHGSAVYYAIEEFSGSVKDKKGAFTLLHEGIMTADSQSLSVKILEGSGSGELSSITGSLEIIQTDGEHSYKLDYAL